MKLLEQYLRQRRQGGRLLIPYVTAGLPDPDSFIELLLALEQAGADAIEVGLPFSDPLADGPVIQRASALAIRSGISTTRAMELCAQVSSKLRIPLIAMGYVNPLLSYGTTRFLADAEQSGIRGLILPDLPLGGDLGLETQLSASAMARIQLATPASGGERLARLARKSEGFVYVVSRLGVTGGRFSTGNDSGNVVSTLRDHTDLPLLTGFGISDAQTAAAAAESCDGVIVGSALLQVLLDSDNAVKDTAAFLAGIRRGIDQPVTAGREETG